jgi:polyisoprenoid-binding protein YceI
MKTLTRLLLASFLTLGLFASAHAAVETYSIDPVHSSVGFGVRHLFSKVLGSFTKFSGTLVVDHANPANNSVVATIDIDSVNTASEKRDGHLKSPDFFDAAKFPAITFKSKVWKKTGEDSFDVTGDLTIKGVTKEVVLAVKSLGFGPGMMPGTQVSGWEATATINRHDFGVDGPAMLGRAVGDDVAISISVEADLKK